MGWGCGYGYGYGCGYGCGYGYGYGYGAHRSTLAQRGGCRLAVTAEESRSRVSLPLPRLPRRCRFVLEAHVVGRGGQHILEPALGVLHRLCAAAHAAHLLQRHSADDAVALLAHHLVRVSSQ